jgi:hypothetical protein
VRDTVREVPTGALFDIVMCSHLLEHVADPVSFIGRSGGVLRPGGRRYFEVPLEIWKDAPIGAVPVTHVNFFTLPSLTFALGRADYDVLRTSTAVCSYGGRTLDGDRAGSLGGPTCAPWVAARRGSSRGLGLVRTVWGAVPSGIRWQRKASRCFSSSGALRS